MTRKDDTGTQDIICQQLGEKQPTDRCAGRCGGKVQNETRPLLNPLRFYGHWIDLTHLRERNVENLSGGELQRFACAVVCIQRADM